MNFKIKKWLWLGGIVLVITAADQGSKIWAMKRLARPIEGRLSHPCRPDSPPELRTVWRAEKRIIVIRGYWEFIYTQNCGGVFSMMTKAKDSIRRPMFFAVYALAMALLVYLFVRLKPEEKLLLTAFPVLFGGAIGNIIDRVLRGYVVDFIFWHIKSRAAWPVFNVADIAISVGIGLVLVNMLFLAKKKEPQAEKQKEASGE
ncbi:MAG: signal peptidase II [Pseudomonadota bacterium]